MTALSFFEMRRNHALWAGALVLLTLAAQTGMAQDDSPKVAPAVPGAMVNTNAVAKPQSSDDARTVTGKVAFAGTNAPADFSHTLATLHSGATFKMLERLRQAKTLEERLAIFQSDEYQKAIANPHEYVVKLSADLSFKLEGVEPGSYEFGLEWIEPGKTDQTNSTTVFTSQQKIVVPKVTDASRAAPVDLGTIELQPLTLPALPAEPAKK